jgi:hypothetical protein
MSIGGEQIVKDDTVVATVDAMTSLNFVGKTCRGGQPVNFGIMEFVGVN